MGLPKDFSDLVDGVAALALGGAVRKDGDTSTVHLGSFCRTLPLEAIEKAAVAVRKVSKLLEASGEVDERARALLAHEAASRVVSESFEGVRTSILAVLGEGAGAFYRVGFPLALVEEDGLARVSVLRKTPSMVEFIQHDIVWIQISHYPALYDAAVAAQKYGVRIVYEVDDAFWAPPAGHQAEQYCTPERIERMWAMVRMADLVTTTTPAMASVLSLRTKGKVAVLPNCLPERMWPRGKRVAGRVLWAGSPSHTQDLELITEPIRTVFSEIPQAHLVVFGQEPPPALLEACAGRVQVVPFVDSFEDYPDALASVGAAVGIAPLVVNEWNEAKSGIKAIEYGACGYPVIASHVGEYPSIARAVRGLGMTCVDTEEKWVSALHHFLSDVRDAHELRQFVKENRAEKNCRESWGKAIMTLVEKRR
jgi:glycosyltransferase involved in cell wall biosynthesis